MENTSYNLHLKGFVGGADFDRNFVDYILDKNQGKPVNVLIDSLGGSLPTALSIASAFRIHGNVTAHFVGMNASAATIASLGAKHISMDENAMYLVHKCATEFFEWGALNADNMQQLIDYLSAQKADLDKLDLNIASMYSAKCKKEPKQLLDLMKVGGWLSAQEALDWGFVDEITHLDEKAPVLTDAIASALASAEIPIPNLPLEDKASHFAKFISALSAFFKSQNNISTTMKIQLKQIGEILDVQNFVADDNKVSLTVEQLQAVESAINKHRQEIDSLHERIAELSTAPAESSQAVIENNKPASEKSEVEQFFDTVNSARKLYELV